MVEKTVRLTVVILVEKKVAESVVWKVFVKVVKMVVPTEETLVGLKACKMVAEMDRGLVDE